MLINYDCIRSVLLALEKHLDMTDAFKFISVDISEIVSYEELARFEGKDIAYSVYMLIDAGYLTAEDCSALPLPAAVLPKIKTITYKGHEFAEHIKNDTLWKEVKNVAGKVGAKSLSLLSQIIASVLTQKINNYLP